MDPGLREVTEIRWCRFAWPEPVRTELDRKSGGPLLAPDTHPKKVDQSLSLYNRIMKRLTIGLSDDAHKRLKVHCAVEGKDMAEVIPKLVEDYLEKAEKKKSK